MGEPAGIGPELIVRIAQLNFNAQLIALADPQLLKKIAKILNLPLEIIIQDWNAAPKPHRSGTLFVEPVTLTEPVTTGELNINNAKNTLKMLSTAGQLALSKKVDAVITGPVNKANLNQVDKNFLGHTEFFAEQAKVDRVVMMLATEQLRICLATTHIPLSKVSQTIDKKLLESVLNTIINGFKKLNLKTPKIAVCGLNPHAGENGLLGDEDIKVINPVINKMQQQKQQVFGPFPADTLFTPQKRKQFDIFLAMYHDQGLPVVKAFGFGQCANITLGLPYIRTSVDHGTALDIAKDFSASADSLEYAINYALQLSSGKLP